MQGFNVIMVYSRKLDKLLMCERNKHPYKGLLNLVGGKIEEGETGLEGAYRELFEETGISKDNITLKHLMDFTYHIHNCYIEVYVGKLKEDIMVIEEENRLIWSDLSCNFFDSSIYAGDGNIGHMVEQVNACREFLFS